MIIITKNHHKRVLTIVTTLIVYVLTTSTVNAEFRFAAYGDSRTNPETHDKITSLINDEDPQLVIHSGDLWDGYSSSIWKKHITSKKKLDTLLKKNKFLVAQGNHESKKEVLNISPSIVKNNELSYSFLEGNVFFVCSGLEPSASYLKSQLQKKEAQNADFRVIFHHEPIYSAGKHGAKGKSDVEEICDEFNVTMSFSGHDHHYERSKVMYGEKAVFSGTDVPADVEGTTYVVTGGGGAPLYNVNSKSWTDRILKKNHFCSLTAYSDRLEMKVKDSNGAVIESFIRRINNDSGGDGDSGDSGSGDGDSGNGDSGDAGSGDTDDEDDINDVAMGCFFSTAKPNPLSK